MSRQTRKAKGKGEKKKQKEMKEKRQYMSFSGRRENAMAKAMEKNLDFTIQNQSSNLFDTMPLPCFSFVLCTDTPKIFKFDNLIPKTLFSWKSIRELISFGFFKPSYSNPLKFVGDLHIISQEGH